MRVSIIPREHGPAARAGEKNRIVTRRAGEWEKTPRRSQEQRVESIKEPAGNSRQRIKPGLVLLEARELLMPGTYRTFMTDPLNAIPSGMAYVIQSQLAVLFSAVVGTDNFYENNWVFFSPSQGMPASNEMLVYFMPPGVSIVKNVPGLTQPVDLSLNGNTVWVGDLRASEVYVVGQDAVLMAKLAFHELMHNRLKQGNAMHAAQDGLGAQTISAGTQITSTNMRSMAQVLRSPCPQWTAGVSILTNGMSDPLSPYYRP
jgi:hypothetical protein